MEGTNRSDHDKLASAYNRFFPHQLIQLLGKESVLDVGLGDQAEMNLTILFSDIRDFTTLSESLSAQETFRFVNSYLSRMEPLVGEHGGVVDKFIGDCIMAIFPESADAGLRCSLDIITTLNEYNRGRERAGYVPINVGIGLNTGLSMLGTVGGEGRMDGTVISDAVNLASRLESATKTYGVRLLISENTYNNIRAADAFDVRFIDRVLVKGKVQPQSVYEVYTGDDDEIKKLKTETRVLFEEALACFHYKDIKQAKRMLTKVLGINPQDKPAQVYLDRCEEYERTGRHVAARELDRQLTWDSSYSVGNKAIDKQHRELFNISVKLVNVIQDDRSRTEITDTLTFLDDYVAKHFKCEEKLMEKYDYPFLDHQLRQHKKFIAGFNRLKDDIQEYRFSKTYLLFRTQILLVDWVVNHTFKEDKHFGKYMKNLEEGGD